MENKAIELLKQLRSYEKNNTQTVLTVNLTPAQAMRNAADAMERKDALLREIDSFLLDNANPQA